MVGRFAGVPFPSSLPARRISWRLRQVVSDTIGEIAAKTAIFGGMNMCGRQRCEARPARERPKDCGARSDGYRHRQCAPSRWHLSRCRASTELESTSTRHPADFLERRVDPGQSIAVADVQDAVRPALGDRAYHCPLVCLDLRHACLAGDLEAEFLAGIARPAQVFVAEQST